MRVLHLIESISRSAGGPSRSAQGLVAGLSRAGVEPWLMAIKKGDMPWIEGVIKFVNGKLFEDVLLQAKPDLVHIHGIWNLELHRCVVICRRWNVPYVIAPRGMLEPWSLQQKWLKKRIARWLYQDRDLKCAAALHATAESEAEQFRKLGFKNPVIISPNGVNVPKLEIGEKKSALQLKLETPTKTAARRALFVSRMHPKKGVLELVEAWAKLSSVSSVYSEVKNWTCELVYTINGDFEREYESKVKARVNELGLQDQFIFTGALNDDEKWKAYARADLFVLPTYSENFGIVVAEALYAGVPVITTKGTPWYELDGYANSQLTTQNSKLKCGWWIDIGVEPLANALSEAMSLSPDELQSMGKRGHTLVEEKYTWDAVVKAMVKGYEEILHARA